MKLYIFNEDPNKLFQYEFQVYSLALYYFSSYDILKFNENNITSVEEITVRKYQLGNPT